MLFSTPLFLFLFLPAVLTLYHLLPGLTLRNLFLLSASLAFYAWGEGGYVALLVVSIAANYGFGLWLARVREAPWGSWALALVVVANLGLLGTYKYAHLLLYPLTALRELAGWDIPPAPATHLPIGLSFFTFQALSYVIDVYRGRGRLQRNPLTLGLYIALFPQLILGPIVRYRDIARQLLERTVTLDGMAEGASRFIVGLGKKVLLADTLSLTADRIFALPPGQVDFTTAWLGVVCFTLQIYYDFSGYADMAIGLGRMFGFRFRENFNYPFISRSRTELFQRWHISFFTWMRDYVYFPLCGKNCPFWRENLNIVIVFFLAGLWHGASWTFIAWGTMNGLFIMWERAWLGQRLQTWWRPLRHAYVLSITAASYAFFRAETFPQALEFLTAMVGLAGGTGGPAAALLLTRELTLALAAGVLGATPFAPALKARWESLTARASAGRALVGQGAFSIAGTVWLAVVLLGSLLVISSGTFVPFIYFRF